MKTGTHSVMKTALKKGSHSSHYSHHSHNSHNSQNSRSSDRLRGEWRGQKGMARWWRPVVLAVVCFFTFFVNNGVLVPVYNQPKKDRLACQIIRVDFPGHEIVPVDCRALIQQHGSLHCATMQFPVINF